MPRSSLAALAGLALALSVAAPAAAQAPGRGLAFVASLKAQIVTTWEEPTWRVDDCHVRTVSEAYGDERITIRTKPIRVHVVPVGRDASLRYGGLRKPLPGMPGKGAVLAEHHIYADHTPGTCGAGGFAPADVEDDHQCEDRFMAWNVQMVSVKGRIGPIAVERSPAGAMGDCTIYRPKDAASIWRGSGVRVPLRELRDRDQEYVVMRGSRTVRETLVVDKAHDHVRRMETRLRWTLRMRRAR